MDLLLYLPHDLFPGFTDSLRYSETGEPDKEYSYPIKTGGGRPKKGGKKKACKQGFSAGKRYLFK
jgi:hypothetical protein